MSEYQIVSLILQSQQITMSCLWAVVTIVITLMIALVTLPKK